VHRTIPHKPKQRNECRDFSNQIDSSDRNAEILLESWNGQLRSASGFSLQYTIESGLNGFVLANAATWNEIDALGRLICTQRDKDSLSRDRE
jgi:hypothetical protein